MKICENCNNKHNGLYGSGRFCSSKCARGYSTKSKRNEINKRVSEKLKGKKTRSNYNYTDAQLKLIKQKRNETYNQKILSEDYENLSFERLRKRIILEQDGKCNKCNILKWFNKPIPLELEHIDGDHSNNNRNNLEALCPNCHSITPTWRGRNKKSKRGKISDEILLKALIDHDFNIRQALISVKLAPKGGNYKRCYRLKKEFNEVIIK